MKLSNFKKICFSSLILTSLSLVFLSQSLQAQETSTTNTSTEVALTAIPPRIGDDYSIRVKPGETQSVAIEVRNPSSLPATVETTAVDFIIGDDGETPIPVSEETNSKWSLASWLTLTPNTAVIQPRATSTILVTIKVPDDALPGGRYAMILHKPISTGESSYNTTGAQVTARVGTLLYVVVDGDLVEDAIVDSFKFESFSEMGPVTYDLDVQNNSSLHIRPAGNIIIKNLFGKQVGELELDTTNIFPESSRKLTGEWTRKWGFGWYTATLNATYGENNLPLTASNVFWIIPVRIILAIALVVILILIIVKTTRKKYTTLLEAEEEKVRRLDEKLKDSKKN